MIIDRKEMAAFKIKLVYYKFDFIICPVAKSNLVQYEMFVVIKPCDILPTRRFVVTESFIRT